MSRVAALDPPRAMLHLVSNTNPGCAAPRVAADGNSRGRGCWLLGSIAGLCCAQVLAGCNVVTGADDLVFECGATLVPTVESCPGPCNVDCLDGDGTCSLNCEVANPAYTPATPWCPGRSIPCPAGGHCEVMCRDSAVCSGATITCPDDFRCTVNCWGRDACRDTVVLCSDTGPCEVVCAPGFGPDAGEACFSTNLVCGLNECKAVCQPGAGRPAVSCGDSCGCTPCG